MASCAVSLASRVRVLGKGIPTAHCADSGCSVSSVIVGIKVVLCCRGIFLSSFLELFWCHGMNAQIHHAVNLADCRTYEVIRAGRRVLLQFYASLLHLPSRAFNDW